MATISRVTTWSSLQILTASALNAEFNNIVNTWNNHNSGSSNWGNVYVTNASSVPLVVNNSTGSVNIANFQANGVNSVIINSTGQLGVGIAPVDVFQVKKSSNINFLVTGTNALAGSICLNAVNDANNANIPLEIRGSDIAVTSGGFRVIDKALQLGTSPTGGNTGAGTVNATGHYQVNGNIVTAQAWVKFTDNGSVTMNKSFNVTSVTRNGTGDYTLNFTNALADTNYAAVISGRLGGSTSFVGMEQMDSPTRTTSALRIYTLNGSFAATNAVVCSVVIFD